jgi:hypothetical protein
MHKRKDARMLILTLAPMIAWSMWSLDIIQFLWSLADRSVWNQIGFEPTKQGKDLIIDLRVVIDCDFGRFRGKIFIN